jgi:antitoxin VapB
LSLSIRNRETVELAQRIAKRTGRSVTGTIHDALIREEAQLSPLPQLRPETEAFLKEFHAEIRARGKKTGLKADKAFFDSLYDE